MSNVWNICTSLSNPAILLPEGTPLPEGYTVEAQTSNPNYLQDNGAVVNNRRITVLAFRNRFTGTEKITLEIAALDNPNAPMQQRQMAAMLRVYTKDTDVATFIDLDRKETRDGIFLLEQYGIIGAGRAVQILDNIITEAERPMNSNFS
jgi:hypothetical protein